MTEKQTAAPDSAQAEDEVMTDEQIWNDMTDEEGEAPDFDEGAVEDDVPDGVDDVPDGEPDGAPDDSAPKTSKDADADPKPATPSLTPEELQAQIERLQHQRDSDRGRLAKSHREIEALKAQIARAEESARGGKDDKTQKDRREKLAKAQEEYGDIIGPLVDAVADLEKHKESLSAREQADLDRNKKALDDIYAAEESVLIKEHPDYGDVMKSHGAALKQWVEDQPKHIRDIYAENKANIVNGADAALVVGLFKQALQGAREQAPASKNERRKQQLAGARSTRSNPPRASSTPGNGDDEQAIWDDFERMESRAAR